MLKLPELRVENESHIDTVVGGRSTTIGSTTSWTVATTPPTSTTGRACSCTPPSPRKKTLISPPKIYIYISKSRSAHLSQGERGAQAGGRARHLALRRSELLPGRERRGCAQLALARGLEASGRRRGRRHVLKIRSEKRKKKKNFFFLCVAVRFEERPTLSAHRARRRRVVGQRRLESLPLDLHALRPSRGPRLDVQLRIGS